jgi:hypothetical protein
MARRTAIRASDDERDAVAERLRHAAAEGRLLASELEHRLALALRARTLGDLDRLVADLPQPSGRSRTRRRAGSPQLTPVRVVGYAAAAALALCALAVIAAVLISLFFFWAAWAIVAFWLLGHRRGLPRGPFPGLGRGVMAPGGWARTRTAAHSRRSA